MKTREGRGCSAPKSQGKEMSSGMSLGRACRPKGWQNKNLFKICECHLTGLTGAWEKSKKQENGFVTSSTGEADSRDADTRHWEGLVKKAWVEERAGCWAQGTVAQDAKCPACTAYSSSISVSLFVLLFVVLWYWLKTHMTFWGLRANEYQMW